MFGRSAAKVVEVSAASRKQNRRRTFIAAGREYERNRGEAAKENCGGASRCIRTLFLEEDADGSGFH